MSIDFTSLTKKLKDIQPHHYQGIFDMCTICFKDRTDNLHISDTIASGPRILNSAGHLPALAPICLSHKCPTCHSEWQHDYKCNHTRPGQCPRCASQTAAEINRPAKLDEIKQQTYISAADAKNIQCEHESLVYNMIYEQSSTGAHVLRENWQQLVANHLLNMEQMIEATRNKIAATRGVRAKAEIEDLGKLTPEEAEQYKRDAKKLKTKTAEKIEKEKKKVADSREYHINKMIVLLMSMNKKLTKEDARKRAEASYEE